VHTLIKEGDKERVRSSRGRDRPAPRQLARSFTVRKISYGVGVERIFPLHTSRIQKIEVIAKGHVRRARLNYLRDLQGKAARIKGEKRDVEETSAAEPAAAAPAAAAPPAATTTASS
jgi:large subunit ribosomal protein L19